MKASLFRQLMVALLSLTLVVLIATLGLARWSFERGFLDYINALEQNRLEWVSGELANDYVRYGNDWAQVPMAQLWRSLHATPRGQSPPPAAESELSSGQRRRPPHNPLDDPGYGPKPPRHPPHAPRGGRAPRGPPTALFDTQNQWIAGATRVNASDTSIRVEVNVGQQVVGYLLSAPRRHFDSPQETAFARQQLITSLIIGLAALLLAVLFSWVMARRMLVPLQQMIRTVGQLSGGDYTTRIRPQGQDELSRLARDINQLAVILQDNQNSRRRWLADISHELRTPVTILAGEIAAIQDGVRPLDAEQLDSLARETDRLRHLIEDLYQLSVSEAGGMSYVFAPMDLAQSATEVLADLRPRAQQTAIQLHSDIRGLCTIRGDRRRIDQLLLNLLNNSLAYTDAPGEVWLRLAVQQEMVWLTIEDTPPGVNAADCEQLFEPLFRPEQSRNRRAGGAGLGLAICRNIVHAHQGKIVAEPAASGGLQIRVTLPLVHEE